MILSAMFVVALFVVMASSAGSTHPSTGSSFLRTASSPSLTVTPNHDHEGVSVSVEGTNFPDSSTANVTLVSPWLTVFNLTGAPYPYNTPRTIAVSSGGGFSLSYSIPDVNPGHYDVQATDGAVQLDKAFHVTSGTNTLTFSIRPTTQAVGGCVLFKGTEFYPMDVENFYLGPKGGSTFQTLTSFDDTTKGTIDYKWTIPNSLPTGDYVIIIVGDTYGTGVADLTVTSGTPSAC